MDLDGNGPLYRALATAHARSMEVHADLGPHACTHRSTQSDVGILQLLKVCTHTLGLSGLINTHMHVHACTISCTHMQ